ncbi:hypothetical protein [Mesomycoplasma ovipneumoniae]|uniref:hypothetical protein n=1 Tax=Mesomycoplasma ovipneumoniae TaxID=29562 RepID=UPI0029648E4D|nr:hypothetical protein [Mesomycoplasma ovipneumoniae]
MYNSEKGTSAIESACFLVFSFTLRFTTVVEIGLRVSASLYYSKFNLLQKKKKKMFGLEKNSVIINLT